MKRFWLKVCFKVLIPTVFLSLLLPCFALGQSGKLVFTSPRLADNPLIEQLSEVYSRIFAKMGIDYEYRHLPAARASLASNSGDVDGELTRVHAYGQSHPNLVRVEEANHQLEFVAYTTDPHLILSGWDSLKGYTVDCRRGVLMCARNVSETTEMHEVDTVKQMVTRLVNGWSDLYVQNAEGFAFYSQEDWYAQIDTHSAIRLAGVMEVTTAHAFLHKKHQALVPRIEQLLREMKQTGEYQRIRGWPAERMQ